MSFDHFADCIRRMDISIADHQPNTRTTYTESKNALQLMMISAAGALSGNLAARAHYDRHAPTPGQVCFHVERMIMASVNADVTQVQVVTARVWEYIETLRETPGYIEMAKLCGLTTPATDHQISCQQSLNALFFTKERRIGSFQSPQCLKQWITSLLPTDSSPSAVVHAVRIGWEYACQDEKKTFSVQTTTLAHLLTLVS